MCKSSDDNVERVELNKDNFGELSIMVNEEKRENIKFDKDKWVAGLGILAKSERFDEEKKEEDDEEEQIDDEAQDKINALNEEIEKKKKKKDDLESKIKEIKEKLETMEKILKIDVSEQEYVKYLAKKEI